MTPFPLAATSLPPSLIATARRRVDLIVRGLVPRAADFCLVHLISKGSIRAVSWAHATADGDRLLRALTRRYRIMPGDRASGVASVLRTGRPLLRTAIQMDAAVAGRGDGTAADLHCQLAPRSALVVPIYGPHAIVGALTLCFSQSGRSYSARHIPAASRIANRIVRALFTPVLPARPLSTSPASGMRQPSASRRRAAPRN